MCCTSKPNTSEFESSNCHRWNGNETCLATCGGNPPWWHLLWRWHLFFEKFIYIPSLKLTAILPLKIGRGPQKERRKSIPTIHFQGFLLLVPGRVRDCKAQVIKVANFQKTSLMPIQATNQDQNNPNRNTNLKIIFWKTSSSAVHLLFFFFLIYQSNVPSCYWELSLWDGKSSPNCRDSSLATLSIQLCSNNASPFKKVHIPKKVWLNFNNSVVGWWNFGPLILG